MNNLLNKKSTLCVKCGSKFKFRKEEKKEEEMVKWRNYPSNQRVET
jgi:hypothetical protein